MVGDGFRVFNYIPGASVPQQRISPFLLLDFNAEFDFGPSDHLRGVDVHPHKGFETVTIAYKGSVAHHDSAGNSGIIKAGDVQWMTAGAGILHKEYHEQEFSKKGGPFEMVQLWVNLPKKDKLTPPHYQGITKEQMGKVVLPDGQGQVNVIAGTFNAIAANGSANAGSSVTGSVSDGPVSGGSVTPGSATVRSAAAGSVSSGITGPAQTYSPVNLFDIKLKKGGATSFILPAGYNTAALIVNGSAEVNGEKAIQHSFILFKNEGEDITIRADEDTVILLLSGEPLNEPIASYGPFVMNTEQEIHDSIREFQSGKFGFLN